MIAFGIDPDIKSGNLNLLWLSVNSPFSRAVSYPFGTCPLLDGLLLSPGFILRSEIAFGKLCEVRLKHTSL